MTSNEKEDAARAKEIYVVMAVLATAAALWLLVPHL